MEKSNLQNQAVFLDRDGVLNPPVFHRNTNTYGAPLHPEDYELFEGVIDSLKKLQDLGYMLFLISNQPDYAKGKIPLESLKAVHKRLEKLLKDQGIEFKEFYYCFHHPEGVISEYSKTCDCRKPGTKFIKNAKDAYNVDLFNSWIIGDRDTDVYCGKSASLKTIQIKQTHPDGKAGKSSPDYKVNSLPEAVNIIEKLHFGG